LIIHDAPFFYPTIRKENTFYLQSLFPLFIPYLSQNPSSMPAMAIHSPFIARSEATKRSRFALLKGEIVAAPIRKASQ